MNHEYWIGRWKRGETGWHQKEVEPAIVQFLSHLKPRRILVPLCGKSLDLGWLAEQGHEVIGVELSSLACQEFFKERGIEPEMRKEGDFTVYRGKNITLFNGDFFALSAEELGKVGAVYDRAALIALPLELRPQYVANMKKILKKSYHEPEFQILQIVLQRDPEDTSGPPFSISQSHLRDLYSDTFQIQLLNSEIVDMGKGEKTEPSVTHECIYRLTPL